MVAGLETLSSGDILIADEQVKNKEPMDRDIAMVFRIMPFIRITVVKIWHTV